MNGIGFVEGTVDVTALTCHSRIGFFLTLCEFTALHL